MAPGPDRAPPYLVRRMSRPELDLVMEWAASERWNPGLHDADCFYVCDPHGFFLGELGGEPIASIAAVALDDTFGFLSFYFVKPEYRGRGFGLRIWQAALDYLGDRNLGLDAVPAQEENYQKSGFRPAYRIFYFKARGGGTAPAAAVSLSQVPFPDLVAYDRQFFPSARPQFLRCWLKQPEGAALGVLKDGQLTGYGVIRACRHGFKVGPLFADGEEIAETVLQGLLARAPGAPVFLGLPESNPLALALAERRRLPQVSVTARMYTRFEPLAPLSRLYSHDIF
jgi:GNAT superfamily N-acetyltransferase